MSKVHRTPAEHYAQAQWILELAKVQTRDVGSSPAGDRDLRVAGIMVAVAQVHATLATVDPGVAEIAARTIAEGDPS